MGTPEPDMIQAELLKHGRRKSIEIVYNVLLVCLNKEILSSDWKLSNVYSIRKPSNQLVCF